MADAKVQITATLEGRREVEREFGRIDSALSDTERELSSLDDAADKSGRSMKGLGDDGERQTRRLRDDVDRATDDIKRDLNEMDRSLDAAGEDFKNLGDDADASVGGLSGLFDGVDLGGAALAGGIAGGIVAAIPAVLSAAGDVIDAVQNEFDNADFRITAAVTSLNPQDVRDLADTITATDATLDRETVNRALNAVSDNLGGLSQDREDVIALARGLATLEQTGLGDANEIGEAVANAAARFGATDTEVLDALAALQSTEGIRTGDLLDVLRVYSGNIAGVGLTLDDAVGILARGGAEERGLQNLDKVADAIREFNNKVALDGGDEVNEALQQLDLVPSRIRNALNQGGEEGRAAFGEVVTALRELSSDTARNTIAQRIFGSPFEDLGAGSASDALLSALDLTEAGVDDVDGALIRLQDTTSGGYLNEGRESFRELKNEVLGVSNALTQAQLDLVTFRRQASADINRALDTRDPDLLRQGQIDAAAATQALTFPFGNQATGAATSGAASALNVNFYGVTDTRQIVEDIERSTQRRGVFQ